jgi:hypothetical protein
MKKLLVFSIIALFSFGYSTTWRNAKGINYHVLSSMKRGDVVELDFNMDAKGKVFSVAAITQGNGNFDVDVALYDEEGNVLDSDSSLDSISVASQQYDNGSVAYIKVNCMSGRGKVVVYAGESSTLLKKLIKNAM